MILAAALLLTTAPAAPPLAQPVQPAAAVGIARARILRPASVTRLGEPAAADQRQTHQSRRRDGARVVDLY
jgi:hypothetical protein